MIYILIHLLYDVLNVLSSSYKAHTEADFAESLLKWLL